MSFRPINLKMSDFTDAEIKALDDLAAKGQLSHTVALALKEYLPRVNPALLPQNQGNVPPENALSVTPETTEDQIRAFVRTHNADLSGYMLTLTMDAIKERRTITPVLRVVWLPDAKDFAFLKG